jgi:hypothetical protein
MSIVNVSIDLDLLDADGPSIEKMVINAAAERMLNTNVPHDSERSYYSKSVHEEIRGQVLEKTEEMTLSILRENINNLVVEALNRKVQQTDTWGEPKGEPKSFKDVVMEQVTKLFEEQVNDRGETTTYHDRGNLTRIQWIARSVAKGIVSEISAKVTEDVKTQVNKQVTDTLTATIQKSIFGK